ncbi:aminopeptidase P family protein [Acidisoma cellulosilytica]|uniref:Aminopeptidase P family protein n=1 Tax=Acidisoma cellulosilyticum TaxID=2802395 RepID=A0A963Z0H4_9PROT|nr:M24 family metallopeptidase [Acidisoma cellulosilyticum]MCB8880444.1 aminopeptidase P family protein [Acidisoma cellulosilyticum]
MISSIIYLSAADLARYETAQALARDSLAEIAQYIQPGATEASLMEDCRRIMDARGATGYWWYGVPAVILAGPRLRVSEEGDVYQAATIPIGPDDMVTIDVAPEIDGIWGDAARSFFLKDGQIVSPEDAGPAQAEGMAAEAALHAHLLATARPEMTFQQLHAAMAERLAGLGFANLDFLGNFGHNIGDDLHGRAYMDAHCSVRLDSVPMFTFEPHIAKAGSPLAFKYEEVYRFADGRLRLL